ncbi:hypothetical protein U91I_03075 [alpha proteobacterium U9-1i]|nr:hypothetical protein U91I_03075 [alpha proteobacterium U9-1i]
MSVDPPPPAYRTKSRLPFEQQPFKGGLQRGAIFIYAALAIGLAGLAVYMSVVQQHPLTSPYVLAPGVGAIWFALRLFMTMAPRG